MAWSSAAHSATQLALLAADKPILVGAGTNRIASATDIRWNTTGSLASADVSHADYPLYRLYDGFSHTYTKPNTSGTAWYLCFDLGSLVTFDSLAILSHSGLTDVGATVSVEIADNSTFATNLQEVSSFGSVTTPGRLVDFSVYHTGSSARVYTTQFIRIKFVDGSAFTPMISEFVVGLRRQLAEKPSRPFDPSSQISTVDSFISSNKIRTDYVQALGQKTLDALLEPHESPYIAELASFFEDDIEHGTLPFLWVPDPTTSPDLAYWMKLSDPELSYPFEDGPTQRSWRLVADEQGPNFVSQE